MKLLFHLTYNLKLHDVISTCFVLNMMRYDGHNTKFNPLLLKFFLGYIENSLTFNMLSMHAEQHPNVNALMYEDRTIPRSLQSTSKKIFKAICLLWSFSVSKSVSYNSAYLIVFCLSTLTELTTNFGLGVLPLGLYMTPTRWGLPKPVLTGRNAQSAKTLTEFSYRRQSYKLHAWTETKNKNYQKHDQYFRFLILLSGDVELNPGPIRIITYNCRSLKESNKNIRKKQQLIEYMRKLVSQTDKYIIMIQEIWINDDTYFKNYWKGQYIFSPGTGKSRGCLTLLSNSTVVSIEQLVDGRGHIAKILIDREEFNIANIYAPVGFSDYKCDFVSTIFDKLYDKTNAIIAGDFNITLRDNERISMVRSKLESDMGNHLNIKIDEQGWYDNWIPDEPTMTWRHGAKQSVLDRVFFNFFPDNIKSVTDWKLNLSDHAVVIVDLGNTLNKYEVKQLILNKNYYNSKSSRKKLLTRLEKAMASIPSH